MKITTKLILSALAIMALGSHATAASFNCHKAATKIEHAICADRCLSELDGERLSLKTNTELSKDIL